MGLGSQRRPAHQHPDDPDPGDYFQIQAIYSEGATGYLSQTPRSAAWNYWSGQYGRLRFLVGRRLHHRRTAGGTGGSIELTTGWSMFAFVRALLDAWLCVRRCTARTSSRATTTCARTAICATQAGVSQRLQRRRRAATRTGAPGTSASRSQWNITKDLYVGLDVIYLKLNVGQTATGSAGRRGAAAASRRPRARSPTPWPTRTPGRPPGVSTATSFLDEQRHDHRACKRVTFVTPGGLLPGIILRRVTQQVRCGFRHGSGDRDNA